MTFIAHWPRRIATRAEARSKLPNRSLAGDHQPMDTPLSTRLRKQLDGPRDGALLRFSLGNALLAEGDIAAAVVEFRAATAFDTNYSAAWKLLGNGLNASGERSAAMAAYARGIEVAEARGDKQASKEMQVFLRRLEKQGDA